MPPWTEERKLQVRRKLFVRRTFKRFPLVALLLIGERYPGYTNENLDADLSKWRKGKPFRSKKKAPRDFRTLQLDKWLVLYKYESKDSAEYHRACNMIAQLSDSKHRKRKIELVVRKGGEARGFYFAPNTTESLIKKFVAYANEKTTSWADLEKRQDEMIDIMLGRTPK